MEIIERITGRVEPGRGLGRTLGFPTANLTPGHPFRSAYGVYLARALVGDTRHWALVSAGVRPTVEERGGLKIEAFLLDFHETLYRQTITLELLRFLRPEVRFDSVESLRAAMEADLTQAKQLIAHGDYSL